jgi:hypothetical protein
MKEYSSDRAMKFTESVIRDMTRVCLKHRGVNLAQGFPDFPAPAENNKGGHADRPYSFQSRPRVSYFSRPSTASHLIFLKKAVM